MIVAPGVSIVNNSFLIGLISFDAGLTLTSIVVVPVGNAVGLNALRVTVPVVSLTVPTLVLYIIPAVSTIWIIRVSLEVS